MAQAVVAVGCEATSTYAREHLLWSFVNNSLKLHPQRPREDCAVCMLAGPGLAGRSGQVCMSVVRGRDEATTGGKSRGSRSGRGSTAGGAPVNRSWLIFKCNHKENEIWRF